MQLDKKDIYELKKRLGDVLYYAASLADYCNLTLSEIANENLKQSTKLKKSRNK